MAEPIVNLNSDMAGFVSGLMFIADLGHNCEKVLGRARNQLDVPAALKLYNTASSRRFSPSRRDRRRCGVARAGRAWARTARRSVRDRFCVGCYIALPLADRCPFLPQI